MNETGMKDINIIISLKRTKRNLYFISCMLSTIKEINHVNDVSFEVKIKSNYLRHILGDALVFIRNLITFFYLPGLFIN